LPPQVTRNGLFKLGLILGRVGRYAANRKSRSGKCGRPAVQPGSSSPVAIKVYAFGRVSAERRPDHLRRSNLEPIFTCQVCGHRGVDIRPLFEPANMGKSGSNFAPKFPLHFEIKYSRPGVLRRTLSSSPPGPWLLSVMRTPVALPPSSYGMEQRYGTSFPQSNIWFRSEPARASRTATQGSLRHAAWGSA
jgi:hypothetical protein